MEIINFIYWCIIIKKCFSGIWFVDCVIGIRIFIVYNYVSYFYMILVVDE